MRTCKRVSIVELGRTSCVFSLDLGLSGLAASIAWDKPYKL